MRQRCWVVWQPGRALAIRSKELLSNSKAKGKSKKEKGKSKPRLIFSVLLLTFTFLLLPWFRSEARVAVGQKRAAE